MELWRYNPIDVEKALVDTGSFAPFPKATNREAWRRVADRVGEKTVTAVTENAEAAAAAPIPALPATLWLEVKRTGERDGYEEPNLFRRRLLSDLTLGECLEGEGRFLDALLDVVWAICEESAWVWPAHQVELTDMERPVIDLGACMTALALAEFDYLLGEAMDPLVGKRLRYEVDRRILTPFLESHDRWWMYNHWERTVNNWTAVCNAGIIGSALYLEPDVARKAEIVSRGARCLSDYLETFDSNGGSTEGPGYWSYGFGHYTLVAHLVEAATGGRISFLEGDLVRDIAQFPLRTMLSGGVYVNFSDCDAEVAMSRPQLVYLAERLNLPDLMRLARGAQSLDLPEIVHLGDKEEDNPHSGELPWALRDLLWQPKEEPEGPFVPNRHDWYQDMMWMIARMRPEDPEALVVATKGGHNGEMHNQNDIGSLIVRFKGESVIVDPGRGRYTKDYFSDKRYEFWVNSSAGHSVPVPNGQVQLPLEEYRADQYRAELLEHRADADLDLMRIDMREAYPEEAGLESLQRTVALHREGPHGWVELVDEAVFVEPGTLVSALLTFGTAEVRERDVILRGERAALCVTYDPSIVSARVEDVRDVELACGLRDIRRVLFTSGKARSATVRLRIEPA